MLGGCGNMVALGLRVVPAGGKKDPLNLLSQRKDLGNHCSILSPTGSDKEINVLCVTSEHGSEFTTVSLGRQV